MSDSEPTFSNILENAAQSLQSMEGALDGYKADIIALVLEDLSKLEVAKSANAPAEIAQRLSTLETRDPRHGSTFVRRPKWINWPDIFPIGTSHERSDIGWSSPNHDDAPIVAAIQNFLRFYGQRDSDNEKDGYEKLLSQKLSTIDLSQEQITLARPRFFASLTFAHLELRLDSDSRIWDGIFYAATTNDGKLEVDSFDFQSKGIHLLNAKYDVKIAGNELDYLRYFLHITRADKGAFRVIDRYLRDGLSQLFTETSKGHHDLKEAVLDIWHPPILTDAGHDGGLVYTVFILYGGAFFKSIFSLLPDGRVDMLDDTLLLKPQVELIES